MELKRVVGQFGTGQFGTKNANGQFGTNIVKTNNLAPGQFGTNITKRTIWHRNFSIIFIKIATNNLLE